MQFSDDFQITARSIMRVPTLLRIICILTTNYSALALSPSIPSAVQQKLAIPCKDVWKLHADSNYRIGRISRSNSRLFISLNKDNSSQSDLLGKMFDRTVFNTFFDGIVPFGSGLSLDQFLQHEGLEMSSSQGLLLVDEVSDIWISLWGCNCKCLSEEEAFETLCAVYEYLKK